MITRTEGKCATIVPATWLEQKIFLKTFLVHIVLTLTEVVNMKTRTVEAVPETILSGFALKPVNNAVSVIQIF